MKPIGIYIHIPFCVKKCAYCDFVSYPLEKGHVQAYFDALIGIELTDVCLSLTDTRRVVETIYIGGGTPTAVPGNFMTQLLIDCLKKMPVSDNVEVTVEMNPGTVDPAYLAALIAAGANRLSIGVQSLNARTLKVLGRIHSPDEAKSCLEAARAAGCKNINLDLIYGTPGETLDELITSLDEAVSLAPEHISVYGLSIPEGTPMHRSLEAGRLSAITDDVQREMYIAIRERLKTAGYTQYEISSWARPGFECGHNLNYWRCDEYLGLGCAASSYLDGVRRKNVDDHNEYVRQLQEGKSPIVEQETLTQKQRIDEAIMLGLRMRDGIFLDRLVEREGYDLASERAGQIEKLLNSGLIEIEGGWLRLTDEGVLVADEVIVWLA